MSKKPSSNWHILVIEDEASIRQLLSLSLTNAGYEISFAPDGSSARAWLEQNKADLILSDWMLPGISGIDLAYWIRKQPSLADIPIIMLTARIEEKHKLKGFEVGVDDYITKPFSTQELIARIEAVLRRSKSQEQTIIELGYGLEINVDEHQLSCSGRVLNLSPTEFKLLHFFGTHADKVYSRTQLLDFVWQSGSEIEERTVDVHIRRLRQVLQTVEAEELIQTVRSVGYRFSKAK